MQKKKKMATRIISGSLDSCFVSPSVCSLKHQKVASRRCWTTALSSCYVLLRHHLIATATVTLTHPTWRMRQISGVRWIAPPHFATWHTAWRIGSDLFRKVDLNQF